MIVPEREPVTAAEGRDPGIDEQREGDWTGELCTTGVTRSAENWLWWPVNDDLRVDRIVTLGADAGKSLLDGLKTQ